MKPYTKCVVWYSMACGHEQSERMEQPQIVALGARWNEDRSALWLKHRRSAMCGECEVMRPVVRVRLVKSLEVTP